LGRNPSKKKLSSKPITNNNWSVTDELGRKLPDYEEVGPIRENRYVGIFYFINHNDIDMGDGPNDVSKMLLAGVDDSKWAVGEYFWGEPEFGYYLNNEEWVIRKHAQQLVDAGVDVIIFDVTNNKTFFKTYLKICEVFSDLRKNGNSTPSISFLASEISVNKLWVEFYKKKLYPNLWFYWKGRPLLLYGQHEQPERKKINDITFSKEIQEFFNLKQSWAWTSLPWYDKKGRDEWPWIDHYPQALAWSGDPSEKEMMPVAVAQHPLSNIGRSFHNFSQPKTDNLGITTDTGKGLFFQEQWDWAIKTDPEFVFVTGWNEWSANSQLMGEDISAELMKWKFYPGAHLGKIGEQLKEGDIYFIDQYNQEFSRDIEPMKGGHSDNYYYQLMANVRKYKGMKKPKVPGPKIKIDILGDFDQWEEVESTYKDDNGDIKHRMSKSFGNAGPYINQQGRNDLLISKVARDNEKVYFYVRTKDNIIPTNDSGWMLLFIDKDRDKSTGWHGYDIMINPQIKPNNVSVINYYDKQQGWQPSGESIFKINENEFMVQVSREMIESFGILNFEFHWCDNPLQLKSINDFFTAGDNAPNRRANYSFKE